jgi:hypothetical protein
MGPPERRAHWHAWPSWVPCAQIINPATRYASNVQWQANWPKLLPQLTAVVVFGDRGGAVGTGCLHELVDAWWRGIPVAMLDDHGAGRQVIGLRIFSVAQRTSRSAGSLVPGHPMSLNSVLRGRVM